MFPKELGLLEGYHAAAGQCRAVGAANIDICVTVKCVTRYQPCARAVVVWQ